MHLELDAVPQRSRRFHASIASQIDIFQLALADGPKVERHRLEQLCSIWNVDLSGLSEGSQARLASKFEVQLYGAAGEKLRIDAASLGKRSLQEKLDLCTHLSGFLCKEVGQKPVSAPVILETVERAIGGLSYREALLYRDWQDALGDAMLVADAGSSRRYKIIGYAAFCKLLEESEDPWIKVLATSLDDIDFDVVDPGDVRSTQLRNLATAVAAIIVRIAQTKQERFLIDDNCLKATKDLQEAILA